MNWHHLRKQKLEPGRSDLENTSPRVQSTAGPYLTKKLLKRDTQLKTDQSSSQGRNKVTNQHLSFSNHISASEAATDSIASETELLLG